MHSAALFVFVLSGLVMAWEDCEMRTFDRAVKLLRSSRCADFELKHVTEAVSASSDIFVDFCGALQSNRYVRKLEIEDATLDDAMIDMLMDALISRSIDLYSLELTSLQFGDAGAQSVSEFLDKTSALRNLKLARNSIGDAGASAIASHMPASLHELDLSNNKVSDTGLINLITAAQDGALLREIELDDNLVTDAGASQVAQMLTASKIDTVRELDLDGNPLSSEGVEALQQLEAARRASGRPIKVKWPRGVGQARQMPRRGRVRPAAASWTEQQVKDWVASLHPTFKKYAAAFVGNAVNGEVLLTLTEADLATIGIDNSLHCKRIASEIAKLSLPDELR